ncbi:MAG: hypothetical protein U1E65_01445 [Myxococcota bacterium]
MSRVNDGHRSDVLPTTLSRLPCYLLAASLAACAAPRPLPPGLVNAPPPRALSQDEIERLRSGQTLAIVVQGARAEPWSNPREPEPPCPFVQNLPPVLALDLPFPVGVAVFPSPSGPTFVSWEIADATPSEAIAVCRVGEPNLQLVSDRRVLRVLSGRDGKDPRRTILITPQDPPLPIRRPDDFEPGPEPQDRMLRYHLLRAPGPGGFFQGGMPELVRTAPRSLFVATAAREPALIVGGDYGQAMLLGLDGFLSYAPWTSLSTRTDDPRLPEKPRPAFTPPVLPLVVVTETADPANPAPNPWGRPPLLARDDSRAFLESLRGLPRTAAPDLSPALNPILEEQATRAAELAACWDHTRCSVSEQHFHGCENRPPGQGCDPAPQPIIVYGKTCAAGEPFQTLEEAQRARFERCAKLERDLGRFVQVAYQRLVEYVAAWSQAELAAAIQAFREK